MRRTGRTLFVLAVILVGALLASALMLMLVPKSSWLAFVGWVIFFVAIQVPWLWVTPSAQGGCTAWLARFREGD